MSNSKGNIGNLKHFTKDYQPPNRGRKPTKFLTELLIKELKSKEDLVVEGPDVETGEKRKIKIEATNKEAIVRALLKKAKEGNVVAIKEVLDRVEGKTLQPVAMQDKDGNNVPLSIVFQQAPGCEPIKESE